MTPTEAADLIAAIQEFETALPGWWWTLGYCGVSRDASCGPARASCGPDYSELDDRLQLSIFDNGFHYDDVDPGSTVAASLRNVMRQALEAKAELRSNPDAARQRYISTLMTQRGFSEEAASGHASIIEIGG